MIYFFCSKNLNLFISIKKDVIFVAISASDVDECPSAGPNEIKKIAEKFGYNFPYLCDESQDVAHVYNVSCTPDFYIFDTQIKS